ncbi:MAG: nickel-dependent lactate racemase [Lentisphaerae bacterium]|nr:nickel-dependent lactate racemase [Lentisphaerota bacterium]
MPKTIQLEFGSETLTLRVPERTDLLRLPEERLLPDPAAAIGKALAQPIGAKPLADLARSMVGAKPDAQAVIVISDNTRPVPYTGAQGILEPLIQVLREQRVRRITLLVATGTHRPLARAELQRFLPGSVFAGSIAVVNHQATDAAALRRIGRTARGTEAWVNALYLDADLKILTGLVEPHFMAGVSGGRKSICPGLVGEAATHVFHGASLMADEHSDSLVLEDNPCHAEALAVARLAGADFIINATVDRDKRLTGVFAGDMELAHAAAARQALATHAIRITRLYDLVVTHAGFAGINHYQAAKAAVEGSKAVRPGGRLVLAACHTDPDPLGGPNYQRVLPLLAAEGPEGFQRRIFSPDWAFVPEQWEVQMWARAFGRLGGLEHLTYCAPQLTGAAFHSQRLPGVDGGAGITLLRGRALAERMVQQAIDRHLAAHPPAVPAVLLDGPYGVPMFNP